MKKVLLMAYVAGASIPVFIGAVSLVYDANQRAQKRRRGRSN